MRKVTMSVVILLGIAGLGPAQANGFGQISAQYSVMGKTVTDPPPGEQKDLVALFLSGGGAKEIYNAMPSRAVRADQCEEGLKLKSSGGLVCASHSNGSYSCGVGLLLRSGETRSLASC